MSVPRNDKKKGTPKYDKLFRVKPLTYDTYNACQAHYHPRKELAADERMVETKAKTCMTQYPMKDNWIGQIGPTHTGGLSVLHNASCNFW